MNMQSRKRLPGKVANTRQTLKTRKVAEGRQNAYAQKVAHAEPSIHHAEIDNVCVIRFGQEFWAVANIAHRDMDVLTEAECEPLRLCRFPFLGPCKVSNADAGAKRIAEEFCRVYLGLGEGQ